MSEVPSEADIQNRNVLKRVVPVVNEHEQRLNAMLERMSVLERKLTELDLANQELRAFQNLQRAMMHGTGATSTGG